jgi:G3E family GTPase
MIPFYLICGWLGSGKTTLLKNILEQYGETYKIAVIQNEFAPTSVDGTELKSTGKPFKLIEINNGSVFCVCQLGSFVSALESLVDEYDPEMIFLESSGLADPISVAEILNKPTIKQRIQLQSIITVIDAIHFGHTFNSMLRFKHQVLVADLLLINKTDAVSSGSGPIRDQLNNWNPFAPVLESSYCRIELDELLNVACKSASGTRFLPDIKAGNRPDMGVVLLRLHEKISAACLNDFLQDVLPDSFRIKGFINTTEGETLAVQAVFDQVEIKHISYYEGRSELILFTDTYSPRELNDLYKSHAAKSR